MYVGRLRSGMKYRKKPVIIEAMQLENNYDSIVKVVEWVENIDMSTSVIGMNATVRRQDECEFW